MKGYVYILTNSSLPGLVKIGMTTNSPHERAVQLSTTGVPHPFKVFGYVEAKDPKDVEHRMHKKLYKNRVSNKREFFKINPQSALDLLEDVTGESEVMRREKAKRLKQEKKDREEKEKKKAYEAKMRNEWSSHLDELQKNTNHESLMNISEYIGKAGWAVFWVALAFFFFEKEDIGIAIFILSLVVGSISLLFDILADKKWEKLRAKANRIMAEEYGENWDGFWK